MKIHLLIIIILLAFSKLNGQQIADTTYNPPIHKPEYKFGKGPVVSIDEGHHNFHTKDGRYKAFAKLLERDGYVVKSYKGKIVAFGEAAMFTAQLAGPQEYNIGMNNNTATENYRLLLNIIH